MFDVQFNIVSNTYELMVPAEHRKATKGEYERASALLNQKEKKDADIS